MVVWHVDDIKISHVDEQVVDDIITHLNQEFGVRDPLTVSDGQVHDYLGMIFDNSVPG